MSRIISYSDLPLLGKMTEPNVETLLREGTAHIELLLDGEPWDEMEAAMDRVATFVQTTKAAYTVHPPAWDTNLTSENRAIRDASFEEYRKSIEFAGRIGATHVVIHPGFRFSPAFDSETAAKRAEESVSRLCEIAAPLGVKLAIENVGYGGSSLFTQDEYVRFVERLDAAVAVYLVDTGHAHINGWDIPALLRQTAPRLGCVHLHDNHGEADEHLPIGEGTIEWGPVWAALALAPDCQLILEYAPGTDISRLSAGRDLLRAKGL
ncbi:sugar phosphate isomerase/epimerase family protein [Paenibacillus ginsengarvi]|uniref:Sugar phosphate isomerase/epimerase n=1 Tax=Paenibacillus ginsengarvi TaxID=400777 RepID=A0A3B0BIY0_9BACL|nr:sugar phosphate isomerase/epimerase family protein [Paenibacillus ginsengarvi]RKN73023.1 sugar phosphate isomerase/epimerase [Paenibacillus ginsengarvi]